MKRIFALNLLLPALIASMIYCVVILAAGIHSAAQGEFPSLSDIGGVIALSLYILFVAYIVAFLPSLIFAGLMSLIYRTHKPSSNCAWAISSAGGLLSGIAIGCFFNSQLDFLTIFTPLGLFTGFILGYIVRRFARKHADELKLNLETLP